MFQRKLVREFICECGKKLAHRDLDSPPNEYTDCTTAWDTIRRIRPFQVFEKTIFTEIYNALMDFQPEPDEKEEGGRKAEEVACNDVCVALALLSQMNLDAKFATIFELFDNDNDGCLTKDQVGDLIYSVCRVAPIVRRDPLGALAQTVFDQSLEENDAMRFTQRAVLALEMEMGELESGTLISVEELRRAFTRERSQGREDWDRSLMNAVLPQSGGLLTWAVQKKAYCREILTEVAAARKRARFLAALQSKVGKGPGSP